MRLDYTLEELVDTTNDVLTNTWIFVSHNETLSNELNDTLDKEFGKTKWGVRTTEFGTTWRLILYKPQYDLIKPVLAKYTGTISIFNFDNPYKDKKE